MYAFRFRTKVAGVAGVPLQFASGLFRPEAHTPSSSVITLDSFSHPIWLGVGVHRVKHLSKCTHNANGAKPRL
eukprot:113794-Pelagomonas_calceolata.AAC.1